MGGAGGGIAPPPPESGPEMGYDRFICPSHTPSILGSPEFPPFTRKISECLLLHTILHFCISSQNVVLLRQACRYQYFCMTFVVSLSLSSETEPVYSPSLPHPHRLCRYMYHCTIPRDNSVLFNSPCGIGLDKNGTDIF